VVVFTKLSAILLQSVFSQGCFNKAKLTYKVQILLSVKRHPCSYNGKKFAVVLRILTLQFKAVEEEKSLLHIKNVKTDECVRLSQVKNY